MQHITCLAVLLLGLTLSAQTPLGQIAGTVQASAGAPHAGVKVKVVSPMLIEKFRANLTDQKGQYSFTKLPEGIYRIEFEVSVEDVERKVTLIYCASRDKVAVTPGRTILVDAVLAVCREEKIPPRIGGVPTAPER